MILRGITHGIKMKSFCDVQWLLVCVDEFNIINGIENIERMIMCVDEFMCQL